MKENKKDFMQDEIIVTDDEQSNLKLDLVKLKHDGKDCFYISLIGKHEDNNDVHIDFNELDRKEFINFTKKCIELIKTEYKE